ncbi:hypothetical protein DVH24_010828 [Malus domestica]|uniref:S-locus glycoprotein domain-containing protein n=1 Tax=Malus domestica TaxID=3750 RepID=A0A498JX20_MALDO|nr:hypothetical protein DVH24_010828 [Malus domestica]
MGSQPRHTTDSSGLCTVTIPGILVLVDINKTSVWSSNTPTSASNPAAQLSDSEWEEKQRIFSSRPQPQPARTSILFENWAFPVLTQDGSVRSYNWINRAQVWEVLLGTPADTCDNYGICGPNGAGLSGCNICLYENDSTENCSCTAFANLDIRAGGSGCSRTFNGNGQDIYIRIRLAASEPDNAKSKVKKTRIIVTSTVLSAGLLILGLALLLRFQKKKHQQDDRPSMPAAVLMLSGESALPEPEKPGFYSERDLDDNKVDPCANKVTVFSANEDTFTLLEARYMG